MELSLISSSHADTDTECLVIGVSESNSVVGSATELDTLISELIDSGDFQTQVRFPNHSQKSHWPSREALGAPRDRRSR